jgi:hypothetical protein
MIISVPINEPKDSESLLRQDTLLQRKIFNKKTRRIDIIREISSKRTHNATPKTTDK